MLRGGELRFFESYVTSGRMGECFWLRRVGKLGSFRVPAMPARLCAKGSGCLNSANRKIERSSNGCARRPGRVDQLDCGDYVTLGSDQEIDDFVDQVRRAVRNAAAVVERRRQAPSA